MYIDRIYPKNSKMFLVASRLIQTVPYDTSQLPYSKSAHCWYQNEQKILWYLNLYQRSMGPPRRIALQVRLLTKNRAAAHNLAHGPGYSDNDFDINIRGVISLAHEYAYLQFQILQLLVSFHQRSRLLDLKLCAWSVIRQNVYLIQLKR